MWTRAEYNTGMFRFSPFSLILGVLAIVSLVTEILLESSLAKIVTTPAIMLVVMVLSEVIRKLRKKLEPDPDDPVYILTIWGVGYKFVDEKAWAIRSRPGSPP